MSFLSIFSRSFTPIHRMAAATLLCLSFVAVHSGAASAAEYTLNYHVDILAQEKQAHVTIEIPDTEHVKQLNFNLKPNWHSDFSGNGDIEEKAGRLIWTPPKKKAELHFVVNLQHKRTSGAFDSYITDDWAIFRGDDLIPAAKTSTSPGAHSKATLRFTLPKTWKHVNAGWEKVDERSFIIDNPERRFDRPTGWMIAGATGTRRETLGNTELAVSAPKGSQLKRMEVIAFLTLLWPEATKVFGANVPHLLIVGAGDPMWRGGLSAPNSFFLHEERPLISENGTSALAHELGHVLSGIVGAKNDDWIAEGLIEFYSIELLYRAGAMTDERKEKVYQSLTNWSKKVSTLRKKRSSGATTARAALLFRALDKELRQHSQYSIDHITRAIIKEKRKASTGALVRICEELRGAACKTLDTPLLQLPDQKPAS